MVAKIGIIGSGSMGKTVLTSTSTSTETTSAPSPTVPLDTSHSHEITDIPKLTPKDIKTGQERRRERRAKARKKKK